LYTLVDSVPAENEIAPEAPLAVELPVKLNDILAFIRA
jgi:hypothetical protein